MSNLNRTLVLTAIIGSTLLTGCASFNRCASGTGNALTSGSVVDTLMGVVFVPLIPICTGVQAFASLDAEDQQALVTVPNRSRQRSQFNGHKNRNSRPPGLLRKKQDAANRPSKRHVTKPASKDSNRPPWKHQDCAEVSWLPDRTRVHIPCLQLIAASKLGMRKT
jgi:hypothetical protein